MLRSFPFRIALLLAALCVMAVLVWQAIAFRGTPDPTLSTASPTVAFMDIGVLVFREGLECVLVLSAITAGMVGMNREHRHPVAVGAGMGFIATLITWFVAVGILNQLTESVPALDQWPLFLPTNVRITPVWHDSRKSQNLLLNASPTYL